MPPLGFLGPRCPVGDDCIEDGGRDAIGDDGDELDEMPLLVREPRDPSADGIGDGPGQLVGRARREQLGHVERIAGGDRVQVVRALAGQRGDGARRERRQFDEVRLVRPGCADRPVDRMTGRRLALAAGQHEHNGEGADPPREQGDHVECGFVGPMDVLEHEHGRLRRQGQLGQEEPVNLMWRSVRGERFVERGRHRADEVVDGAQGPRDREVVARADENAGVGLERADEARHERGLADSRLADHDDGAALPPRGRVAGLGQRRERPLTFQELHGSTIDLPEAGFCRRGLLCGATPRPLLARARRCRSSASGASPPSRAGRAPGPDRPRARSAASGRPARRVRSDP